MVSVVVVVFFLSLVVSADLNNVESYVERANQLVQSEGLTIDPITKIAEKFVLSTRAAGVNKVVVYWNFARIFVNKNTVNNVILGSTTGLAFLLGVTPGVGITIGLAGSIILSIVGTKQVSNGIWFDYNYFIGVATANWGWQ